MKPLVRENLPKTLDYLAMGMQFVWKQGRLVWTTWTLEVETIEEARPPDFAWRAFWKKIEKINPWDWGPIYSSPNGLTYPVFWKLSLSDGKRRVETRGGNALPPGAFYEALVDLFYAARRVGRDWEPDFLEFDAFKKGGEFISLDWKPTRFVVTHKKINGQFDRTHPASGPTWEFGYLILERSSRRPNSSKERITPSRAEWERFWARIEKSGFWREEFIGPRQWATPWSLKMKRGRQTGWVTRDSENVEMEIEINAALEELGVKLLRPENPG